MRILVALLCRAGSRSHNGIFFCWRLGLSHAVPLLPMPLVAPTGAAAPTLQPLAPARQDRGFYFGLAIAFLLTAIVGFGPTYFFKPVHPSPPLTPLLHAHGLVFTGWLILLVVQTGLVRAHQVAAH